MVGLGIPSRKHTCRIAVCLTVMLGCSPALQTSEPAATPGPQVGAGFYSLDQAERGGQDFRAICGECHSRSEFRGSDFEFQWRRQTVWDLFRTMRRTMPEDMPGLLPDGTYADVIAYILQLNEYESGDTELAPTEEAMDVIPLGPGATKQPSQDGGQP